MSGKSNRQPGRTHRARRRHRNSNGRSGTDVTRMFRFAAPDTHEGASRRHRAAIAPRLLRSRLRPARPGRTGCIASTWTHRSTRCVPIRPSTPPATPLPLPWTSAQPRSVTMLHVAIDDSRPVALVRPGGSQAASRMIGGPSSPDADADVSAPARLQAARPVRKPRSARACRGGTRSPAAGSLRRRRTGNESDDLDEDDLVAIARGSSSTAALSSRSEAPKAVAPAPRDAPALERLSNVSRASSTSRHHRRHRAAAAAEVTGPGASRTRGTGAASQPRRRRPRGDVAIVRLRGRNESAFRVERGFGRVEVRRRSSVSAGRHDGRDDDDERRREEEGVPR